MSDKESEKARAWRKAAEARARVWKAAEARAEVGKKSVAERFDDGNKESGRWSGQSWKAAEARANTKPAQGSDNKATLVGLGLIGILILGIWLFPTFFGGILIPAGMLLFVLSLFRLAGAGMLLSVLMFVFGGFLLSLSDSEPVSVDSAPTSAVPVAYNSRGEPSLDYS